MVENPKVLGFHQEQMETMEDSTEISGKIRIQSQDSIPGLVLYQTLYYLLDVFHPKFSKVKDKRKEKFFLQVSVIIQKFKIQKSLF